MTDTPSDIARPAKRSRPRATTRVQASVQRQAADQLYRGLDRFGIAPVLLLGLAYVTYTSVLQPIAKSYSLMIERVSETNSIIKDEITKNNLEDTQRVAAITAAQTLNQQLAEANRELNNKILDATAAATEDRRKIHAETQALLERVEKLLSRRGE